MSEVIELNEEDLKKVIGGKKEEINKYPNCHGELEDATDSYDNYSCYVYIIGQGDMLSYIALDFGYGGNYKFLADFNGISNPDLIYAGNKLYIPVDTNAQNTWTKKNII